MAPCVSTRPAVDIRNAAAGFAHPFLARALSQEPAVNRGSVFVLAFNALRSFIDSQRSPVQANTRSSHSAREHRTSISNSIKSGPVLTE